MMTSLAVAGVSTLALFGSGLAASRDDQPAGSVEQLSAYENGRGSTGEKQVEFQSGPFAPGAWGRIAFNVQEGVLSGHIEAESLPAQGSHAFYVLWFVRTDTNDKAFLGPIVGDESILFMAKVDGEMSFTASEFTDGPNKGSPISLGTPGDNFFVVIAEDHIDTFMPFPVSKPPSSFALTATF